MTTRVSSMVLANTAVTAGTYGGASNIPVVTIDAQGRATFATNATPSIANTQITGTIIAAQIGTLPNTQVGLSTTSTPQFGSLGVGTAASGVIGEIRAANNITAYYSSDIRFKENVTDIPDALEKVDAIGGKLFDWTDEYIQNHGGEDGYFVQKADFGVIAQDVQSAFPIATRTRPDGSLAVDYEKLCALAFAAIKELKKEIEILKGN